MRRGAKVIVTGDGTSIWTVTHNTDFAKGLVGLLGKPAAIGEDFHITSDEALDWNQIYTLIGEAAGVEPDIIHVPSDGMVAADPEMAGGLLGDKIYSTVFDNSKLRSVVPDFAGDDLLPRRHQGDGRLVRRRSEPPGDRSRGERVLGPDRERLHRRAAVGG